MEKTFNMVQKAFNLGEDVSTVLQHPPRPPLSDSEFRKFLDPVGQIMHNKDLRSVIYLGGIDPSLRFVYNYLNYVMYWCEHFLEKWCGNTF